MDDYGNIAFASPVRLSGLYIHQALFLFSLRFSSLYLTEPPQERAVPCNQRFLSDIFASRNRGTGLQQIRIDFEGCASPKEPGCDSKAAPPPSAPGEIGSRLPGDLLSGMGGGQMLVGGCLR